MPATGLDPRSRVLAHERVPRLCARTAGDFESETRRSRLAFGTADGQGVPPAALANDRGPDVRLPDQCPIVSSSPSRGCAINFRNVIKLLHRFYQRLRKAAAHSRAGGGAGGSSGGSFLESRGGGEGGPLPQVGGDDAHERTSRTRPRAELRRRSTIRSEVSMKASAGPRVVSATSRTPSSMRKFRRRPPDTPKWAPV